MEGGEAGGEESRPGRWGGGPLEERDGYYTHKSMAALNGTRDDGWPLRLTVS